MRPIYLLCSLLGQQEKSLASSLRRHESFENYNQLRRKDPSTARPAGIVSGTGLVHHSYTHSIYQTRGPWRTSAAPRPRYNRLLIFNAARARRENVVDHLRIGGDAPLPSRARISTVSAGFPRSSVLETVTTAFHHLLPNTLFLTGHQARS